MKEFDLSNVQTKVFMKRDFSSVQIIESQLYCFLESDSIPACVNPPEFRKWRVSVEYFVEIYSRELVLVGNYGNINREHDLLLLIQTVNCLVWNSVGKIINKK